MSSSSKETSEEEVVWTKEDEIQFDADFAMAIDMLEFAMDMNEEGREVSKKKDNFLERFKKSGYPSAKRLSL
jgi:hypothetical protein